MRRLSPFFWKRKPLAELAPEEWEALCDGCAKCCLHKLQDEDTEEVYYTNVVCRLLDIHRCRCTDYPNRSQQIPTCLVLNPHLAASLVWMPNTCAYRLLAEGKELPWWHPLVSQDTQTVHQAGISVRGKVLSESDVDIERLEEYVVDWFA
jgi:uncharacterized cysteine cluster protein YcgN (CxxCxxCC family)